MSNILVTGGLGTIGAGLITELRGRGHHVVSCDLPHQPDEIGFSLRTDVEVPLYARCDVGEFRQIERVFERCGPFDYVYHCAAEFGRWNGEDFYETLWRTNAIGTKNLIDSVLSSRLRGTISPKSFNNDIGVPLAIFPAEENQDYLVLEMGTNHHGEIKRLTEGRGVDVAIEALGRQETFENALRAIRPGGTLSSLGVYSGKLTAPYEAFYAGLGDQKIVTTLCPGGKERMRRLMAMIANRRVDLTSLVSHHFALDDIQEAFDLFSHQRDGVLKVALYPDAARAVRLTAAVAVGAMDEQC